MHRTPGFTKPQISVLLSLAIIALIALGGLGFALFQNEILVDPSAVPISGQQTRSTQMPLGTSPLNNSEQSFTRIYTPSPTVTRIQLTEKPYNTLIPSVARAATATPQPSPTSVSPNTPGSGHWRIVIGSSVEGRPLEVHRFGTGPVERMVVAGIHGGYEWNTIALADQLIDHLHKHIKLIPSDRSLFILRSLNPDGEARGHTPDGRANANGVDLNRNWNSNWQPNWPRAGCWNLRPTTGGPYPNSEPETLTLINFLLARNIDVIINYHSAGLGILPSGDPPNPESIILAQSIASVSNYPYPPIDTGCKYTATLVDWALKLNIIGVDLELTDHIHTDFKTNLDILSILLNWPSRFQ